MTIGSIAVRRLTAEELPALQALLDEGRAADAFAGSSDRTGRAISWVASIAPDQTATAWVDERLVGVLSPEVKAIYVAPDVRRHGIGRRLVEEASAIERARGRPNVLLGRLPDDATGEAFLRATAFAYHSTLWDMELGEAAVVPEPRWPDDIVPRNPDLPGELGPFITLFNVAFADHATPMSMDGSMWRAEDEPYMDRGDLLVLEEADRPRRFIGFCMTDIGRRPDEESGAEVWTLGVLPDHRGRGLGRELLRWGVHRLRSVSDRPVTLSVNGRNERALSLYEREGFARTHTRDRWARPVG